MQRMCNTNDIDRDCHCRSDDIDQLHRGDVRFEQFAIQVSVPGDDMGG